MLFTKLTKFFSTKHLSHIKGSTSRTLSEDTISKALFKASLERPDHTAIISEFQSLQITFKNLFELSRRAAANMLDLGLAPGSKVGLYSPNCIEWLICQYACSLADLNMVSFNPAYKSRELIHGLGLTQVETLIVSDDTHPVRIFDNVDSFMQKDTVSLNTHPDSGKQALFNQRTCGTSSSGATISQKSIPVAYTHST